MPTLFETIRPARLFLMAVFLLPVAATADSFCATPEQAGAITGYYAGNPGTAPLLAARALKLPEAVVASGLPAGSAVSAPPSAFPKVWAAMSDWQNTTFLIVKGTDIFEIASTVGPGARSEKSPYFNIEYKQPVHGHLRPDLWSALYAFRLPGKDGKVIRAVTFYGADGNASFAVIFSGEGPPPPEAEVAKFDWVMALVEAEADVCPAVTARASAR